MFVYEECSFSLNYWQETQMNASKQYSMFSFLWNIKRKCAFYSPLGMEVIV